MSADDPEARRLHAASAFIPRMLRTAGVSLTTTETSRARPGQTGADTGVGARRTSPATLPQVGDNVGGADGQRFLVEREIGQGAMGVVFLARDLLLERRIALKFLRPRNHDRRSDEVALLLREARAIARLDHENIVRIFDVGIWRGSPYLVMEYLKGQSLLDLMGRRQPPANDALKLVLGIVNGLERAHGVGIIHRDLKPGNVFVLDDGRAKILDFGLALPFGVDGGPRFRNAGTPGYMSPEQWRGAAQDHRTDLWSAGVILYELLTGELPYECRAVDVIRDAVHRCAPLIPIGVRDPSLPPLATEILDRALQWNPDHRFQTAAQFGQALGRWPVGGARASVGSVPSESPQRRQVTLVSCLLEGLGESGSDDEADELQQDLQHHCREIIARNGGVAATLVGHQMLALFGFPTTREFDAQSAVRAALTLVRTLSDVGARHRRADISVRLGIHTAMVSVDATSHSGTGQDAPALRGEGPTRAAQLALGAAPNTILLSVETARLVRGSFLIEREDPAAGPRAALRALGERRNSSRLAPLFPFGLTRLIGREGEFSDLTERWNRARAGQGGCVVLLGEAGIGKSRLLRALQTRAAEQGAINLTCQAWPHTRDSPLHPLIDLFLRLARIDREQASERKVDRLERLAARLRVSAHEAVPLLAALLSISVGNSYAPLEGPPRKQREEILAFVRSALTRLAQRRPVLCAIEDLHWLDHSSREFFGTLAPLVAQHRVLILCTARPQVDLSWDTRLLDVVRLTALTPTLTAELVREAAGGRTLSPAELAELVERSQGVPLFAEELTRCSLAQSPGTEQTIQRHPSLPAALQAVLADRLDRTGGFTKNLTQLAAVLGRTFTVPLLEAISDAPVEHLDEALGQLVEAGIFERRHEGAGNRYAFHHVLVQEAAYQILCPAVRRRHHGRVAAVLRARFPETVEAEPEMLAYHEHEARAYDKAVESWMCAGRLAFERSANEEAIGHFRNALESLSAVEDGAHHLNDEIEIRLALGNAMVAARGYGATAVQETFGRARALCNQGNATPQLPTALRGLWQYYFARGEFTTAGALAEQVLSLAESRGDEGMLVLGHRLAGTNCFPVGNFAGTTSHLERALSLFDPARHSSLATVHGTDCAVASSIYLAWNLCLCGRAEQGATLQEQVIDRALSVGEKHTTAFAYCYASTVRQFRREPERARRLAEAASAVSGQCGFALWIAWSDMIRGWAMVQERGDDLGVPVLRQGIERWVATGGRTGLSYFYTLLGDAHLRLGAVDEGLQAVALGLAAAAEIGEGFYLPELKRIEGELLLKAGAPVAAALGRFTEAFELARQSGAAGLELRVALAQIGARWDAAARAALAQVWSRIDHSGSRPDIAEARIALDAPTEVRSNGAPVPDVALIKAS